MPVDQKLYPAILRKLDKQLSKLSKEMSADNVHKFRTISRRVETILEEFCPVPRRGNKKLLKSLARLRKKAGQVRDLDVQMALLRNLKTTQERKRQAQLLRTMTDEKESRQKKLAHALDSRTIKNLRKSLKQAKDACITPKTPQPMETAQRRFAELVHDRAPLTEKRLHEFRIRGKAIRYLAELAGGSGEARRFISSLKHMQDVIGDWHDWLKLTKRAEALFPPAASSPLVSVLRNLMRAKFRHAVDVLTETQRTFALRQAAVPSRPERKPPEESSTHHAAVA
jgi:CHAD domain-containing protein